MKVVTFVRGRVPVSRRAEFESMYAAGKQREHPQGLEISFLLRSPDDLEAYTIMTIWSSLEDMEAMRKKQPKSRAVSLFEGVGFAAKVERADVAFTLP